MEGLPLIIDEKREKLNGWKFCFEVLNVDLENSHVIN